MDTPTLSVVIPAFNEAARLPAILDSTVDYLNNQFTDSYEIIVVDDGGIDSLQDLIHKSSARLLRHNDNRGKGAAVRTGVMAARGELILVSDADGATPINEELALRHAIQNGADIALGSRFAPSEKRRRRDLVRGLTGQAFAVSVRMLLRLPVLDTQCGFKMFRRSVAQCLFRLSCESGFLYDVEILLLAQRLNYTFVEVPVSWQEMGGSRLKLLSDSAGMAAGICRLRERFIRTSN